LYWLVINGPRLSSRNFPSQRVKVSHYKDTTDKAAQYPFDPYKAEYWYSVGHQASVCEYRCLDGVGTEQEIEQAILNPSRCLDQGWFAQ
jgi:hypothetical protein